MNQNDPTNPDSAWEEAMSRDFDARVRDLHEAPLDVTAVKGKAHKIRRNRRAAVAGGVLGVAAVITPVAVLSNGGDTGSREPDFAPQPTETATDPADGVDYVVDGVWHQADGDVVPLPETERPYDAAVLWNDQLVASRFDGEVFSVADVIDAEGDLVTSFPTTGPVAVNDAGTTIAWVSTEGRVMTRWDGGEASLGAVDLSAPGDTTAWTAAAVTGGPACDERSGGCTVFVNSSLGEQPTTFSSRGIEENVVPEALSYHDATTVSGFQVTYVSARNEDASVCTGLFDLDAGQPRWDNCDYDAQAISPNGQHVVGAPAYGDGLGHPQINILDAETGTSTGKYAPEGGFISTDVAWSESNRLLFSAYDGSRWHLIAMAPDGSITEVGGAVKGKDFDSPFTLIQH